MDQITSQIPIGRFSILTRISQKNLRSYDENGILSPEYKDIATGYRYYSTNQISIALKINILKRMEFSNTEILEIMQALQERNTNEHQLNKLITKKANQLQKKIDQLQNIASVLRKSKTLEELLMSVTNVEIKDVQEVRVISKREKGTYNETVGKLIGTLMNQIFRKENNPALVRINGPIMTLYHDREYKEQDADIEVAIPVVGRLVVDEDIELKKIAGGKVVTILHTGPYYQVGIAWDQVMQYIEKKDLQIKGLPREVYLNDPNKVPEEQLLTEIQIPIVG